MCLSYSRDALLSLRNTLCTLDCDVRLRIKSLIKFRGCRAGRHRHQQSSAVYTAVTGVPGIHVITDNRPTPRHWSPHARDDGSALRRVLELDAASDVASIVHAGIHTSSTVVSVENQTDQSVNQSTSLPGKLVSKLKPVQPVSSCILPKVLRHTSSICNNITCATFNIRSLSNKLEALKQFSKDENISILCLTETWLENYPVALRRLRS